MEYAHTEYKESTKYFLQQINLLDFNTRMTIGDLLSVYGTITFIVLFTGWRLFIVAYHVPYNTVQFTIEYSIDCVTDG